MYVEIFCIVFLIFWILFGLKNGMLYEISTLILTIISFLVGYFVAPVLVKFVSNFMVLKPNMQFILQIIVFFIASIVLSGTLGKIFSALFVPKAVPMSSRIVGGFFAMLKGLIYLWATMMLVLSVQPESNLTAKILESRAYNYVVEPVSSVYVKVDNAIKKSGVDPFEYLERLDDVAE